MGAPAIGLFAGIGGLEIGLEKHGWRTELLCDVDRAARMVLRNHFPDAELCEDIAALRALPSETELVAAGFPCQDLSQAGRTVGIRGKQSAVVNHVFRLIKRKRGPRWVLLENVPFMLQLGRGAAMRHITGSLGAWVQMGVSGRRCAVIRLTAAAAASADAGLPNRGPT